MPTDLTTSAHTKILNGALYAQENLTFLQGKIQIGLGMRYDEFWFRVRDQIDTEREPGRLNGGAWQPKASFAYTPAKSLPLTLHANYGRSITSTNARALLSDFSSPRVAKSDFYQFGTSHNKGRLSLATSFFWIRRTNELIYVADDGSNEFTGPSTSFGYEGKTSVQLTRVLAINLSATKVLNAYFRDTNPREYIPRAPHFTGYAALTLSTWKGWSGSLRVRGINKYILIGDESQAIVAGHTVADISIARRIFKGVELNFAVDNLLDRSYFETFELYTSRLRGGVAAERVHGTPGYPRTIVGGLTFRLFPKRGD